MIETKQGGAGTGRVWMRAKCLECGEGVFQAGAVESPPPLDSFKGIARRLEAAVGEHVCDPEAVGRVELARKMREAAELVRANRTSGTPRVVDPEDCPDWMLRIHEGAKRGRMD